MDETSRNQPQLVERVIMAGLAFCIALPMFVLVVRMVSDLPVTANVVGDPAVIELYALRATTGTQLLGPYSRFGFHHPGPLGFYCLAPFYLALGKTYAALCVGALVLNLASLIGIAVVVWRVGGPGRWPWSCAAIAAYVVYLGPAVLVSPWNPDMAILPLAFSLVSFAAVIAGYTVYLPAAVLAGSFAVQSHLTCAGPVACAALLSLVALTVRRGKRGAEPSSPASRVVRHLTFAAILGVVVWLPPIIEQLRDDPGNVTLILRFLGERHGQRELGSSLLAVATQASAFLLGPLGAGSQTQLPPTLVPILGTIAGLVLFLLVLGALSGWRRRDAFVLASCVSSVCLLLVGLVVTRGIIGQLHLYLVRWVSAVGLLSSIAVVAAFFRPAWSSSRTAKPLLAVGAAMVLTMGGLALRQAVRFPTLTESIPSALPERLSDATVSALAARGVYRPHVRILSQRSWEQAAGVVLQCAKAGRLPSVDPTWLFMFGEACRFRGADDGVLLVADPSMAAQLTRVRAAELVATTGNGAVFLAMTERAPIRELPFDSLESEVYLRGGFSKPETDPGGGFRWSNGASSSMVLPAAPGTPYQLQLLACPIVVRGVQQGLTVEVNGTRIATVKMKPAWTTYTIPVSSALMRARNLIVFRYSVVRSPHELSGKGDRRQLAVRFRTISLGPA